ncbi:MAG TPA: TlpA family protein disulfide reductase [Flavobacteriaceae bacterium]|nr:TlpA family protein disulfide reductase [Flavobacteriaceae bacterium]
MRKILLLLVLILSISLVNAQKNYPNITLKNLDNKEVNLVERSKDKLLVISFWATWCGPCIQELEAINDEYKDLQEEMNFELIAVSIDNSRSVSRVKPMVNGKDWDYEVLLDTNQEMKKALNFSAPPYLLIVKDGKILYTHSGYTPGSEEEAFEKFRELSK